MHAFSARTVSMVKALPSRVSTSVTTMPGPRA